MEAACERQSATIGGPQEHHSVSLCGVLQCRWNARLRDAFGRFRLELQTRFGGVYLDTDVMPISPLDEMCPSKVRAWAACERLDIVGNAAMDFPVNHLATWLAVAMIEESFFESRHVGDRTEPGLFTCVVTQYDAVAICLRAYFHSTVGKSKSNPEALLFLQIARLFVGTRVKENRRRPCAFWAANQPRP